MGAGHKKEGVVLRPLVELTLNNGARIICKHKRVDFSETKTPREPGKDYEVLQKAEAIAEEWVTPMRLEHVIDSLKASGEFIQDTSGIPKVIAAMLEDVTREGHGDFVDSKAARGAIGKQAALLFKKWLSAH
jgi:hypothetical protein